MCPCPALGRRDPFRAGQIAPRTGGVAAAQVPEPLRVSEPTIPAFTHRDELPQVWAGMEVMRRVRMRDDGIPYCWACGSTTLLTKSTEKGKRTKHVKCDHCGERQRYRAPKRAA